MTVTDGQTRTDARAATAATATAGGRGTGRLLRWGALIILAVAWPFLAPMGAWFYGCLAVIYAIVALSLTVLSGWTAQISLGHAAFLGLGVYAVRPLLERGVPVAAAVVLAGLAAAAVSLLLGVPSLRLRGVHLAIVTLAFGMVCQKFLFGFDAFSGGGIAHTIEAPAGLDSDRALYLALLVPLGLCLALVARLRASDAGRVLFAIRDSEEAAQSLGVSIARYKIGVFALSAGMTGLAGGCYGVLIGATPAGDGFGILQSWFFLAMPVIGGMESAAGAVVGAVVVAAAKPVVDVIGIRLFLACGALTVAVLLARTGGIVGALTRLRDELARVSGEQAPVAASFLPEQDADPGPPRVRVAVHGEDQPTAALRLVVGKGLS